MRSIARRLPRGTTVVAFPAVHRAGSFTAELSGDVETTLDGDATFGEQREPDGALLLGVCLGPHAPQGGLLLTWRTRARPANGIYPISARAEGWGDIRGRVFLGPSERPIAELVAESGTLRIIETSRSSLAGSFTIAAVGRQRGEALRIRLRGAFTARAS